MVAFFVPPPPFRTSSASGYTFTMTAGTAFGFTFTGYYPPYAGSIDGEPLDGFPLTRFVSDAGSAIIAFAGDATTLLGSSAVWIDGISYAAGFIGWYYDPEDDLTGSQWMSGAPAFVDAGVYSVEIK